MKITTYLLALAGLTGATLLVAYHGFSDVFRAVAIAGWGLIVVALFHVFPMVLDTLAWRSLFSKESAPSLRVLVWVRWIREAVDGLLPVAKVGGELVGTRLLMMNQIPGTVAGASVVVDLTLSVFTQLLFTVIGLGLLVFTTDSSGVVFGVFVGIVVGLMGVIGFLLLQKRGLFTMLLGWLSLVGGAERLDRAIKTIYHHRKRLLLCAWWQMLAWIVGAGEVWLALYFLGHPVSILEALLLESLGQAVRNAAFAIPGSLGVQEGGYMLLGGILGLTPETGLALSLAKRVRELLLGVPALVNWQLLEGRQLWNGRLRIQDPAD